MSKLFVIASEEAERARAQKPFEVEVPELSTEDRKVTVRFKGFLRLDEYNGINEYVGSAKTMGARTSMFDQALFAALAIDEDGKQLVPEAVEEKQNWFERVADPVLISKIVKRGKLFEKFYQRYENMATEPPEDAEDPDAPKGLSGP